MTFVLLTETIKKDVIKNSMLTEHNKIFLLLKKILCPVKMAFSNEGKIKIFQIK